ncbi:MAG: 1-deoxy-D-xylulose-5-phosphate reductoisomerase [Thermodesulfobacteriota bacterium]|jgi:1-deoxy-D-xylulose-5-phosphate reductoisomerase|nr:MAG: 1-deoxy-D-xylulose-5-phosphate reductoisomerase [Thermodesulfobacteriota bacterium]
MKKISILGSTGFIGTNTLKIIAAFPERYKVVGLAAGSNVATLSEQIKMYKPEVVAVSSPALAYKLKDLLTPHINLPILVDQAGMIEVATYSEADLVVSAMVGSVGLIPTMAAIRSGKRLALANKETLVVAGKLVMEAARSYGVEIIPIDSEHSAIFQVLQGQRKEDVSRLILTASGGPFLNHDKKQLKNITPEEALKHPVWKMGKKITIDSATLMNKGLEVIEARWLFNLPPECIQVVIHPQSIIHSMVEYCDGSTLAQMSLPDMRLPISYALAYPERLKNDLASLNLANLGQLTFFEPDVERFPALRLAYQSLQEEESLGAVLNGANEVAVEAFLKKQVSFSEISLVIKKSMDRHNPRNIRDIEDAIEVDAWARQTANKIVEALKKNKPS